MLGCLDRVYSGIPDVRVTGLLMLCDLLFSLQLVFRHPLQNSYVATLAGTGPPSVPFAGPIASNEWVEPHL